MRKRRIIRALKINEISGVDRPAQEGAQALIMKRDGGEAARIRELEDRKANLEDEIGALDRAEDDRKEIEQLEAEIGELEITLEQRKQEVTMGKSNLRPRD